MLIRVIIKFYSEAASCLGSWWHMCLLIIINKSYSRIHARPRLHSWDIYSFRFFSLSPLKRIWVVVFSKQHPYRSFKDYLCNFEGCDQPFTSSEKISVLNRTKAFVDSGFYFCILAHRRSRSCQELESVASIFHICQHISMHYILYIIADFKKFSF